MQSTEETLIIENNLYNTIFITSNISNLRTFENNKSSSFIYQRKSSSFSFIVLPSQEPFILKRHTLKKETVCEIFVKEKSFINFLSTSFDSVTNEKLWFFDYNKP